MEKGDELNTRPEFDADERKVVPALEVLARVVAALADQGGAVSPRRFGIALDVSNQVGAILGQPALSKVFTLRAFSIQKSLDRDLHELKVTSASLSLQNRTDVMRCLCRLLGPDVKPTTANSVGKIAASLGVRAPEYLTRDSVGSLGAIAGWANSWLSSETQVVTAARDFAYEFGEEKLLWATKSRDIKLNPGDLIPIFLEAVERAKESAHALIEAAENQAKSMAAVADLEKAADEIERVARQRFASITRRAKLLKRHCREDLIRLSEDAVEEYENDLQRALSSKALLKKANTHDLNDKQVIKNLERRYKDLSRRYQDELDLLDCEVSEFVDEFTRVVDDALRPIDRHEFRKIAPLPRLEHRVKAAADTASQRTLLAGGAGVVGTGVAIHAGVVSAAALATVVATPVGAVVLGTVAIAGMWKVLTSPGERQRKDVHQRADALQSELREMVMARLPDFERHTDEIIQRFKTVAENEVVTPRLSAGRLKEIAEVERSIATEIMKATTDRIQRVLPLLEQSHDLK